MSEPKHRSSLILGGARSGKSRFAESLVMRRPPPWRYIATAQAFDDEMTARIGEHRRRRGPEWITLEAPLELADVLAGEIAAGHAVLVDCLTLWLSNVLLAGHDVEHASTRLVGVVRDVAARANSSRVVIVSNEVGMGIVPDTALARTFRDAQGRLNQRIAACVDHVVLMAAGLPLVLKDGATAAREDDGR